VARRRFTERFDFDGMLVRYEACYRQLLAREAPGPTETQAA